MSNPVLHTLVEVRKKLSTAKHDKGEITGGIILTAELIPNLQLLADNNIVENLVVYEDTSVPLDKIKLEEGESFFTSIVLYTRNLSQASYYENVVEFLRVNQYQFPEQEFYIHKPECFSNGTSLPLEVRQFKDVIPFIDLLFAIADYVKENIGEPKDVILFHKRKLTIPIKFSQNDLREISFIENLWEQISEAHDKEERKSILKNEIITSLIEVPEGERFSRLLSVLDGLYDNYLKSHLLYLEKFSYHDLKTEVDKDKLDFTRKIYATVNDIQAKLIAVPAAFLLVLAQFDFTGMQIFKNILIVIGSLLFAVLLEVLLRNQFGILKYIEREIFHFKSELSNKDTSIDLTEFISSFADLEPITKKQRVYLWIFRVIVWLVPLTSGIMLIASWPSF